MNEFPERQWREDNEHLPARLAARFQEPLPGPVSHRPFAASLCYGRHRGPILPSTRQAAVLVLLVQLPGGWQIPMTVRPAGMQQHAGQVCFPGGALEPGEDVELAALREASEELGITVTPDHVLGQLTPLWVFASDFWVTPVVASCPGPLHYRANPSEVADVIEVSLAELADPSVVQSCSVRPGPWALTAPAFCLGGQVIWGASSMILGELIELCHGAGDSAAQVR
ncbi:MAG: CoA pyrophosphatase [Pirellulaceae bacterium]|nr:CoA pyrophosphatase [Pirellulaceae bacterium]